MKSKKKLLIYIPTFTRLANLKKCISCIDIAIRGFEHDVLVHVSDNASTDKTYNYLVKLKKDYIEFSVNKRNIGLGKNILKGFTLNSKAEFTWIIGDDDFVMKDAIYNILNAFNSNPKIDFYFLNTFSCPSFLGSNNFIFNFFPFLKELVPKKFLSHSRLNEDFVCQLKDLINPEIDPVFSGALMCYAFRSRKVTNLGLMNEKVLDFNNPLMCYPHSICFLNSLRPNTPAMHLASPFTFNFWHKGESWGSYGYDLAVTHGLGYLFFEALQLGYVAKGDQINYFHHYYNTSSKSFINLKKANYNISNNFKIRLLNFLENNNLTEKYKFHYFL
jgi:glycosyltransferase involved in cell wall biosynthesis